MSPELKLKPMLLSALRQGFRHLLRFRSLPPDLTHHLSVVVIAPHPDDETFGCGSWIAHCRKQGLPVRVIVLSDGAASHPHHPVCRPDDLISRRMEECRQACLCLGVESNSLEFWGLPDGRLDQLSTPLQTTTLQRLRNLAEQTPSQLWLIPSRLESSTEHLAARQLVLDALASSRNSPRLWEYWIWAWRNPLCLLPALVRGDLYRYAPPDSSMKIQAISCYLSQITATAPWTQAVLPPALLQAWSCSEEFFLGASLMIGRHSLVSWGHRILHRLGLTEQGSGRPVPAAALDQEYASGAWDHFYSPAERPRFDALLNMIESWGPTPSLLELGCGSGRLVSLLPPGKLRRYMGVDLSKEGLKRAQALGHPQGEFVQADFEQWKPDQLWDLIVFNESIGYARHPARCAAAFARHLSPEGRLLVSHFRHGDSALHWEALEQKFQVEQHVTVSNDRHQHWDLKMLRLNS
ncbi:MAG: bifunctional PIG-L family deacetylase/class I SAM-dependent methyltransferase [Blastochloris sp.]|nr:bifunctional PIG-L family deacetylase/class I SAM-dependent methyltransferase [Blastochloris sp.]